MMQKQKGLFEPVFFTSKECLLSIISGWKERLRVQIRKLWGHPHAKKHATAKAIPFPNRLLEFSCVICFSALEVGTVCSHERLFSFTGTKT